MSAGRPVPDMTWARQVTERKATTFAAACRLLPAGIRADVYRLYLVFRTLDDLVDEHHKDARQRVRATRAWAEGRTGPLTDEVSLELLSERFPLSKIAIVDFCRGMEQDLEGPEIRTERDLDRYCYRVAGTVGLLMSSLLGGTGADAEPCAIALGTAMQRTNILRDLDEDLRNGRIYLSAEARQQYGDDLTPGRRWPLIQEQIARADDLYEEGLAGVRTLRDGQLAIRLAACLYREILREIEQRERRARTGRAVVSGRRKLAVSARMLLVD